MSLARAAIADDRSSAQKFLDDFDVISRENILLKEENTHLKTENSSLLAEVQMLREELGRVDKDRVRLQGFSVNLATRLSVIKDTIDVALRDAALQKVDPNPQKETPEQAKADTAEIRELVSRFPQSGRLPVNQL